MMALCKPHPQLPSKCFIVKAISDFRINTLHGHLQHLGHQTKIDAGILSNSGRYSNHCLLLTYYYFHSHSGIQAILYGSCASINQVLTSFRTQNSANYDTD